MVIRGGWVAGLLVGLGASSAGAEPAPPRIQLRWSAPEECPDDLTLLRRVEGFLGESLDRAADQPVAIDVRVQGDAAHGYAAKLSFVSAQGKTERALEHPNCSKLTEGVALLVALGIDPERVRAQQEKAAVESSPAETVVTPAPLARAPTPIQERSEPPPIVADRAPSVPTFRNSTEASVRASVAIVGLVGGGMLPGASPGIGPELALRLGHFEAAAVGRFWAVRNASVPGTPDASVDLSLFTAGLRLCGVPTYRRWSWLVCARGDLGRMSGDGQQVDQARTRHDLFAGFGGSLAVAYAIGRFSPIVGADLLALTARPSFGVLRGREEVVAFRPQPWQLSGFVGLGYAL